MVLMLLKKKKMKLILYPVCGPYLQSCWIYFRSKLAYMWFPGQCAVQRQTQKISMVYIINSFSFIIYIHINSIISFWHKLHIAGFV